MKTKNAPAISISKKVYTMAASDETGSSAEITMYGDIYEQQPTNWWGEPIEGQYILLSEFLEDLKQISSCKNITIRMNSYGGDAGASNMIHNRLRELSRSGAKLTCIVDGVAMSGGSIIMCACDTVKVNPSSIIMIHKCWQILFGGYNADELREQRLAAGSAEIDGVSGSTITSEAVMKAAKSCYAQAKGEAVVSSVQLPTGDENDWLGTEPDFDEAAITETVDTDILIVGAGNGGMFAAAYAAANGLNFRIIEQNGNVQDTRHWYGAIDSAAAKAAGEEPFDRAKLLSEISRYASGKCDQRVVKTWINESAAMHDFMRSILEDKYGWVCDFTSGSEAAWPAENAEHNTDYLYPVQEHNYMASERESGLARNELLLQYI